MGRMECVECGTDVEGDLDRAVLPYRCTVHRDEIVNKWMSVFGDGIQYDEYGIKVDWSDAKKILTNVERHVDTRTTTVVMITDKQRHEMRST